jgi:hypothetical protein
VGTEGGTGQMKPTLIGIPNLTVFPPPPDKWFRPEFDILTKHFESLSEIVCQLCRLRRSRQVFLLFFFFFFFFLGLVVSS